MYLGEDTIVNADEIDDDLRDRYDRKQFRCTSCGSKLEFNRGIDKNDPHFKNGKGVVHLSSCFYLNNYNDVTRKFPNLKSQVDVLTSIIIPRAKRIADISKVNDPEKRNKLLSKIYSKQTKKFLYAINELIISNQVNSEITICTENNERVSVRELIKTQDAICALLDDHKEGFTCIVKGVISKKISTLSDGSYKLYLTHNTENAKYGNKRQFYLFIPKTYVEKNNIDNIRNLTGCLIYCYGHPERTENYGDKMNLFFIDRQIYIIRRFD